MIRSGQALIHLLRYLAGLDVAATQTTEAERECLARYSHDKKRLVEIGVFEGATTRLLADNMSLQGELFAIDPFIKGRLGICWGRPIAHRQAAKSRGRDNIQFIELYSHEAATKVQGEFDLVFMDGDHSLGGITQDWTDWAGQIISGGIAALHDTCVPQHNPNVRNLGSFIYFESFIRHDPRFELLEQMDSLSVLRRR